MKVQNAQLRQMLAAEYALGTLRGRARRRFEKLVRKDHDLRAVVTLWETRLAGLADDVQPVAPAPSVWQFIQQRIGPAPEAAPAPRATVTPIRKPAAATPPAAAPKPPPPWRILAGLATAAAVVLAVLFGSRVGTPPVVATAPPAASPVVPQTIYVSLLRLPESDMQWTLSVKPQLDQVIAVASGAYPKLGEHSLELWLITDAGPVSLGLLPTAGEGQLKLPPGVGGERLTLAVSLEPVGGSPTGKPTGPVLTSGPAIKAA